MNRFSSLQIAIYAFIPFRTSLPSLIIMGIFWHIFLPLFYNFAFLAAIMYYRYGSIRDFVLRISAGTGSVPGSTTAGKTGGAKHTKASMLTQGSVIRSHGQADSVVSGKLAGGITQVQHTTGTRKASTVVGDGLVYLEDLGVYVTPFSGLDEAVDVEGGQLE